MTAKGPPFLSQLPFSEYEHEFLALNRTIFTSFQNQLCYRSLNPQGDVCVLLTASVSLTGQNLPIPLKMLCK